MNRIVILGDSLGIQREIENSEKSNDLLCVESYPNILKELLLQWEVISSCKGGNRSDKQARQKQLYADILLPKPKVVVVQLGICDCTPRLFNRYESFVLSRLPLLLRGPIISHFSKHRYYYTKHFRKVYVKINAFESNIRRLIDVILGTGAFPILVGIADTNTRNKERTYNYERNIIEYNDILIKLSNEYHLQYINMFEEGDSILLPDGIHLNETGSNLLAKKIFKIVSARSF
jgi:lysophospholipase L1-like esterase